jgi:hypothetical protein
MMWFIKYKTASSNIEYRIFVKGSISEILEKKCFGNDLIWLIIEAVNEEITPDEIS